MLKIILTALIATAASIASAQTAEEQVLLTYKVACASDAEITVDQQLLSIVGGDNQDVAKARQDIQLFVASPKALIEAIVNPYNAKVAEMKAELSTTAAAELQTEAEKYSQEKGVTIEEAKEALLAIVVDSALAQQQVPPVEVQVYQAVAGVCGLLTYIQPEITKSGCKTAAGEVADVTAAAQFCTSVAPQLAQISETSGQLNSIQQQAQALIAAVTASIQRDADTQMAPLMDAIDAPFQVVVKAAMDLIAVPAPVQVPEAPVEETPAPTEEAAPTAPEAPAPGDDVPPPMQDPVQAPAQP